MMIAVLRSPLERRTVANTWSKPANRLFLDERVKPGLNFKVSRTLAEVTWTKIVLGAP
jgi:hypothetical protein